MIAIIFIVDNFRIFLDMPLENRIELLAGINLAHVRLNFYALFIN